MRSQKLEANTLHCCLLKGE